MAAAYAKLPIGDPTTDGTLVGPLVSGRAHASYAAAVAAAQDAGGELVVGGERVLADEAPDAYYVQPTVVRMKEQSEVVHTETFAPLLYVMAYDDLDEAIALNNAVPQGLSSSIFTSDLAEAECSSRRPAPTAASSTSTSAPPAPRSAARSAARRRPAAAASRARTPGGPTCAARPTPSTTPATCRSPRASDFDV